MNAGTPAPRPSSLLVWARSRAPSTRLAHALLLLPLLAVAVGGCRVDLPASSPEPPSLRSIAPERGHNGADQAVTLVGASFTPRVTQDLGAEDGLRVDATFLARLGDTALLDVEYVDAEHLSAVVPAGIPAGSHALVVTTPFGEELTLSDAYVATASPAPVVVSVVPSDVVNDVDSSVTVRGGGFASEGVTVELLAANAGSDAVPLSASVTDESELVAEIPAGVPAGSYALRVTQEGLSGKLDDAVTVHEPASLVVTVTPEAAVVPRGEPFTIAVLVENRGGSAALDVTVPSLTLSGAGAATLESGPAPAGADLNAGESQTFTFRYDATTAGELSLSAAATGENEHSGRSLTSEEGGAVVTVEETATPASLSGAFEVQPTATTSQTLSVDVVVTNAGEAAALLVLPSEPSVATTGGASATLVTSPVAADVPGLGSATFTFTYAVGAASGTLSFTTEATGSDEHSAAVVTTGLFTSPAAVVVQTPPALSGTLSLPSKLSAGQAFEATLLVENTGEATAALVLPAALVADVTGAVTTTLVSAPSAEDVPPGAPVAFVWQYTVGAGLGTLSFSGEAAGVDANSGAPVGSGVFTSGVADVEEGAALVTAVTAPPFASVGSNFNVVVEVQNVGAADALAVAPQSAPAPSAAGLVSFVSGPVPTSSTLAGGGGTATFTYTYAADDVGTLTFSVSAAGSDEYSGDVVSSAPADSQAVEVQPPPDLAAVLSAPSPVSEGQTFTVTMTMTNYGGVDLSDVEPSALAQIPAGAATLLSAPAAPFPTLAAGGGEAELTWTYTAGAAGTFTFEGTASGTDVNSAGTVASPLAQSNAVLVEVPPSFSLAFTTRPSVTRGQSFEVTLAVQNLGEAAANGVTAGDLVVGGTTGSTCGAPTPASQNIAGGAQASFSWTCTAGDTSGAATFSTTVSGSDVNSAALVTSAPTTSDDVIVQSPAALSLAWTLPPTDVSYGQSFSVSLVVTNAGEASATVLAGAVTVLGATGTTCGGTTPTQATVNGNDSASFTYACTAGGTSGSATFTASANGSEDNTGAAVTAGPTESQVLVVESPAALSASWGTLPARVAFAEAFTAELTVTNAGEAPAANVSPSGFTVSESGTTCGEPTPASATVAASSQQIFSYACTGAAPAASAVLSAGASGSDQNAGATVTAAPADSSAVLVGSVAVLDVTLVSAAATTVYRRQAAVPVTLSVQNLGEASANVVSASDWLVFSAGGVDVSGDYTVVAAADNPTVIAGGATAVFAFEVDVGAAATLGPVTLDGAADGTDALDGSVTSDAGATTTDAWTVAINQVPIACFVSDFSAREVDQLFTVDATCSDDVESAATLTVEWDWQSDGTFDTAATTTRTATHAYAAEGLHTITLRVTDDIGFSAYASYTVAAAATGRLRLVTNANPTGAGSFTDAVALANGAVGPDTIAFDRAVFAGTPTTITLGNGQSPVLLVDSGTRIIGHDGVRISASRGFTLQGDDNVMAYLEVTGAIQNNSYCVDVQSGSDGNRLLGNRVESCDVTGLLVSGVGNTVGPGNVFAGNYADTGTAVRLAASTNDVVGNTFTSCGFPDPCVDVLAGTSQNRVLGNVIHAILNDGVRLAGTDHEVHHNTMNEVPGSAVDVTAGSGHSVRNNIFTSVLSGAVCDATADLDVDYNNLFDVLANACEATQGPNSISADPLYTDAANGDFTLLATSPCLDAGDAALGLDVNGAAPALYDDAAPDLGALERNPG